MWGGEVRMAGWSIRKGGFDISFKPIKCGNYVQWQATRYCYIRMIRWIAGYAINEVDLQLSQVSPLAATSKKFAGH